MIVMIDEKDRQILEILELDARTPYTEIAKELGVSESTVRKRVDRMEKNGVIKQYTIITEPAKRGYGTVTILGLDVEPARFLDAARELSKLPQVRTVSTSTGDHMIMAEIWTKDGIELSELISRRIGSIRGVKNICPAILLERMK